MMKDAIAFMTWNRVVPWKILSLVAYPDKPLVPIGFGARYWDFYDQLEPGSQIWVVTRISNEFSLAGRVTVEKMLDRNDIPREKRPPEAAGLFVKWRFVAVADPKRSEFFETNNAEPVLAKHGIKFTQSRTVILREASLEEDFKDCVAQGRKTVFLSYRWKEGRRFAFALARELRKNGYSPWLDALSIPKYKASREPGVDAPRLEKLIKLGIEKSKFAIVINSATYAQKGWTKLELDHIRKSHIAWYQVMRGGTQRECDEASITSRRAKEIIQEILRRRRQPANVRKIKDE
jgi:hypothetical protein